ncbi:archaeal flagellin-like protein [Methanomethylovorans hollandica DSM 15978]|uniref:Flagellin n=1 Tax=Methanomethylovorans hollandica (strain DSM 15978 / NBRC 107637 / DMS1) TaxID=867904 RepID=L0KYP5_METHD|nr:archaellin/type IV pilin N-terminal domain-containing protein [Methanomethylovorans hollandica]AGB49114.1 archaeal flagellin-like protein [Methanomethylovorans hollandica DSM 15978]
MARERSSLRDNTSAQIGIGTLIIFIAMVLIAAVAASVLIQTSGVLQQMAHATGKQATQEVSSNLVLKSIEGIRAKNSSTSMAQNISLLKMKVGLNVGSSPVDLNQLVISVSDGTNYNDLIYGNNEKLYGILMSDFSSNSSADTNLEKLLTSTQASPGDNAAYFFTVSKIRDEDVSFSQGSPIMNTGDLATIYVSTVSGGDLGYTTIGPIATHSSQKASGLYIGPRTTINLVFTPEAGTITIAELVTPSSYGIKETIKLYP